MKRGVMDSVPLRVCYFGTYRERYTRNRIMITGLRRNHVVVTECHVPLWHSIADREVAVRSGWRSLKFWWRIVCVYLQLVRCYWSVRHTYDILVVGYPGQFDVLLARVLSWWQGKPLVWDVFMSIYLISLERGLQQQNVIGINLLRGLEWLACRLPDRLILDTEEYVAWFHTVHGIAADRFRLVPTGADSDEFYPRPPQASQVASFQVIYYGTFIPNHGVHYLVEAAHLLADDPTIHFALIGEGPDRAAAMQLAQTYHLTNISFVEWLEPQALTQRIADADLCVCAFGTTPQSLMTIQNKIYEGLAMRKPVLTGDGPAVRRQLPHGEALYLCERANPKALAAAIETLRHDPALCRKLAQGGHARFLAQFTLEAVGRTFKNYLLPMRTPTAPGA